MPYLKKSKRHSASTRRKTESRKLRQSVYCTERWKRMRIGYLMQHPVCELCERRGIVTLAVDVHHIRSFQLSRGDEMLFHAYNPANLMALCKHCHNFIHRHGATTYTDLDQEAEEADRIYGRGIIPQKEI